MNITTEKRIFQEIVFECENILISKGDDYSGQEDRLKNFKKVGETTGMTPYQIALVMIVNKVERLGQLSKNKGIINHESVQDNTIDLINYAILSLMILEEENSQKKETFKISTKHNLQNKLKPIVFNSIFPAKDLDNISQL